MRGVRAERAGPREGDLRPATDNARAQGLRRLLSGLRGGRPDDDGYKALLDAAYRLRGPPPSP